MTIEYIGDGNTDGTSLGQSITEKISFHGVTPIAQPAGGAQVAAPAGGTGATAGAYDTAAHRNTMIALVTEMRDVLINAGLMKGAA
jgi:hypothetical protein